jgi:hypothetical protein
MLNEWIKTHPDQAAELASGTKVWPVLKSPIPRLSTDERKVFEKLRLRSGSSIAGDLQYVHHPRSKTGIYAWGLYWHVRRVRDSVRFLRSKDGEALNKFRRWMQEPERPNVDLALALDAAELEDLGPDSLVVDKWWKVAKKFLVRAYPSGSRLHDVDETNEVLRSVLPWKPGMSISAWHDKLYQYFEQDFEAIARTLDPRARKSSRKPAPLYFPKRIT